MQTIVLATQKGGSGKSTLAIGLALAAIQAGHTVRLIETDPQGTLSNWQRRRPHAEPIVEPVYAASDIERRLQSLDRGGVTLTIVDTAGGVSAATNSAIRYADLCLIPTRPSVADIEATAATLRVIRAWRKPFAYIMNQTPIRGTRLATAETALSDEAARDIADVVARPFIVMRNDHQDALSVGLAASEYAPAGKSAEEIRGLWQWIEARMNAAVAADVPIVEELAQSPAILPAMAALRPIEHDSASFLRAPAQR
jgi:chromosome partitioning protein